MRALKNIIIEKLKINKDTTFNAPNEEVLILEADLFKDKTFDKSLFITGLENLNNKYPKSSLIITVRGKEYLSLSYGGKKTVNLTHAYLEHSNFIELLTYDKKPTKLSNDDIIDKLINELKIFNKDVKQFRIGIHKDANETYTKYMYVWYSKEEKVMRIDLSDDEYKTLLNKDYFE